MIKQQDIIDKANEDFVKFKARQLHLGKEKIFQQSEKINLAKKVRRFLTDSTNIFDNLISHQLIDMENVYDVFYKYYKEMQKSTDKIDIEDLFMTVINNYQI